MVTFTDKDANQLEDLIEAAIMFANDGSRIAYKTIQSLKPRIDIALERWTREAKENKGPAK